MKKFFLMAMTLILSVSVMAQQKIQLRSVDKVECVKSDMTGLKARFSFSSLDASKVETTRGELSEIHIDGTFPNGSVGEPQLPMFTRLIAIPTGATPVVTVATHSETQYTLSDYGIGTVAAMQAPVRKNIDPSTVEYAFSEVAYSRDSYNDDPVVMVEVLGTMRGITLGRIIVRPVRYNPVAGTVKVFNDIEVDVDFQNGDAASTAQMFKNTFSPAFNSAYGQIFNIDMLMANGNRDAYTDHPDFYNTPVKMLVICYSGFKNNSALNSWLEWKLQKGYYVDIFYTDQTGTTSSAIASFIKTKYNASVSAGNAYTYLITIGDTGQVPYYSADYEDSDVGNVASDLGYASVDFSTNSNDVFPDMYYSRMSVENTTHLTNYINKVLTYEKYEFADGGNYLNNVILVGGWDRDWTSVVARPTINYATTYYFNSSNTTYGGFSGGTIKATISTSSTQGYSGNNNGCYQGINNGVCFVNYTAHGNKQEWTQPLFTAAQVATLTNTGKYFFGVGNCCLSGNFNNTTTDYSPGSAIGTNACFAETMIRVPNAGAVAYIGCSDYTIWMEDYYWAVGSGIHFNYNYDLQGTATTSNTTTGVYDAMFRDDYWNSASSLLFVGNIAVTAAENNSTGYDVDQGYKYYFKYYHTFGDGSVMPYVTKPETNTVTIPSTINAGSNSIIVNAVAGSYVAVTNNSSVIYGVGVANASGVATVNFTEAIPNNGTLHVVVTRQQYQPYFGSIEVIATGEQYTISATANPTAGGSISGTGTYYENSACTLTATSNSGYGFTNWTLNGSQVSTNPSYTFTVTGNATYTANFHVLQQHSITYNPQQSHGTISVSPANAYAGDIVTLTATPDAGYVLDYWTVTTASKETIPVENNQFVMPDRDVTISATFRSEPVNLTIYNGSATNEYVPIYGYWADSKSKCEFIIPKEKLSAMTGGSLSAMKFYLSSSGSNSQISATFDVFVKEVSATTLTGYTGNSNATTVFSNTITIAKNASDVEFDIPFSSDYIYNGGNLLVGFYQTGTTSFNHTYWYGELQNTNTAWSGYGTQAGSAQQFLPKITFTYVASSNPYISLAPASATVLTGFTQTLTATYGNVSGTPTITYSSSNTNVATVSGSGTTATVTGVAPGTATITASMTYQGTTYTATCAITVEDPSYCTPNPSSRDGKGITALTFGTDDVVNNSNSNGLPASSPYYGDYTSMVGSSEAGETVTVTITYSTGDYTVYSYGTIIWVDWNKNYEFEDSEIVYTGTSAQGSGGTPQVLTATFTVPATQAADDYRMRIAGADSYFDSYIGGNTSANHSPCFSSTYAVCHDYTLRVIATGAYTITCATTTGGTITADKTSADENDVITVTATPETDYLLTALTYTPEGGSAQNIDITSTPYTFTMPAANVTVNATFTLIRNLPPYHLTVGTPLGHSVELGWTGVSTNTNHQNFEVYYSTTNTAPSDNLSSGYETTTTVPYTLAGLDPSTTYYAWVRDNCGTDGKSAWVAFTSFTTDVSCPAPNNLTVSNLTAHSANVSWNGEGESYTVLYHTATVTGTTQSQVFFDGFENGLGNWTTYAVGQYTNDTWEQVNAANTFTGGSNHSGSYVAMSRSYYGGVDVSVDNWLVTPQMTLGDVLKFWVCGDNASYQEYFAVYVSTGSNAISDFAMVVAPELAPGDGTWAERTVDLSAYAGQQGYIAIRHQDEAKDFLLIDDFGVYTTVNTYSYGTDQFVYPTTNSCQLTGLTPETLYEVQVIANCGNDGTSTISSPLHFTTPDNCGAPQELAANDVLATTATLTWADDKESYNLKYRKVYFYEGFEGETLPTGWTTINANNDGNTWGIGHATTHTGNNGATNISFIYNTSGTTPNDYLVSPQLDLQGILRVWLSGFTDDSNAEHFEILLSTSGNSVSDFTTTLVTETITSNSYVEYTADLSSYAGQKGYIAIHHFNCTDQRYLYVDDFGLYGTEGNDGWVTLSPNPTTETANLTGLTPGISYEWQVQGNDCSGIGTTSEWSAVATFTTLEQYTKTIQAVGAEAWAEGKGGYYLIASPLANNVAPTNVAGMITDEYGAEVTLEASTYDLYSFDQAETDEWRNYRASNFNLVNGQGYLYASKEGTELVFTGAANSNNTQNVTLSLTAEATGLDFPDWNLVGNPFAKKAYISKSFYTLENSDTYTLNTAGTEILAMQGLLVIADYNNEPLNFTTVAPNSKVAKLNMNVSKDRSVVDQAIISFNEGQQLPKLQFRNGSTKVYMPMDGKEYAIVSAEAMGTMPVNFKAESNGTYTLSFTTEEVSFAYLHLIDNMTGIETDLLANPSYSFDAKTTDYESRFKLVFATGNNANDDAFAFYSNGSFVINNEGEATLQVIDMNGRILKSESINGCANVDVKAAAGVYVLRLVNGNDVKVQKVVVK